MIEITEVIGGNREIFLRWRPVKDAVCYKIKCKLQEKERHEIEIGPKKMSLLSEDYKVTKATT